MNAHQPSIPTLDQPHIESHIESHIDAAVDALRDELVAFTRTLVRLPSPPGHEQAAQRAIAAKYEALGLATDVVPSTRAALAAHPAFSDDGVPFIDRLNVVARWPGRASGDGGDGGTRGRSLILNGHMDVVPPGDVATWTRDPWGGAIVGGRLYGRGSCDMKAGLAAAAFAVQALQSLGVTLRGDVLLESVIGEETGGIGTLTTIVAGYRADACVIMEPTALRLCPVHSGALSFRLTVRGRGAHAANKADGVSAIVAFAPLLAAIERLDAERHSGVRHPLFGDPRNVAPISVGTVRAGDWPSSVPDLLVAEGRLGVFPDESIDDARAALVRAIHEAAAERPWLVEHPPEIEWFEGQFEPGSTPRDAGIVRAVTGCHADVTGAAPDVFGLTAGTDLRLFTRHAGIPTVMYGPGDLRDAHAADESVSIAEMVTCAKVLARTMVAWCGM